MRLSLPRRAVPSVPSGRGRKPQPGMPVPPPAPAHLGCALALATVTPGATTDPDRGSAGVVAAAGISGTLGLARADGHEAGVGLEQLRPLEQPADALVDRERTAAASGKLGSGLLRRPVLQVVAAVETVDPVQGTVWDVDTGDGE